MKRVELEWVGLDPLRSWACSAVRRAEGQAPRERRKASRGRTALLALNAELNCKRNCPWSTERESRRKRRNFKIMLFLAGGRVKENRRALLCKRSGGDGKSARLKSRSQGRPLHGGRKGASREVLQMKILGGAREERFIADKFMIRSALVLRGVTFRTDCSWRIKVDARSRQREGQGRRGGFEELGRQRLRVHGEAT